MASVFARVRRESWDESKKKKKKDQGRGRGDKETPAHMLLSPPVKEKSRISSSHDAAHTSLEAAFSFREAAILLVSGRGLLFP